MRVSADVDPESAASGSAHAVETLLGRAVAAEWRRAYEVDMDAMGGEEGSGALSSAEVLDAARWSLEQSAAASWGWSGGAGGASSGAESGWCAWAWSGGWSAWAAWVGFWGPLACSAALVCMGVCVVGGWAERAWVERWTWVVAGWEVVLLGWVAPVGVLLLGLRESGASWALSGAGALVGGCVWGAVHWRLWEVLLEGGGGFGTVEGQLVRLAGLGAVVGGFLVGWGSVAGPMEWLPLCLGCRRGAPSAAEVDAQVEVVRRQAEAVVHARVNRALRRSGHASLPEADAALEAVQAALETALASEFDTLQSMLEDVDRHRNTSTGAASQSPHPHNNSHTSTTIGADGSARSTGNTSSTSTSTTSTSTASWLAGATQVVAALVGLTNLLFTLRSLVIFYVGHIHPSVSNMRDPVTAALLLAAPYLALAPDTSHSIARGATLLLLAVLVVNAVRSIIRATAHVRRRVASAAAAGAAAAGAGAAGAAAAGAQHSVAWALFWGWVGGLYLVFTALQLQKSLPTDLWLFRDDPQSFPLIALYRWNDLVTIASALLAFAVLSTLLVSSARLKLD
jgi:Abscisic acid G-protein coupled receptor